MTLEQSATKGKRPQAKLTIAQIADGAYEYLTEASTNDHKTWWARRAQALKSIQAVTAYYLTRQTIPLELATISGAAAASYMYSRRWMHEHGHVHKGGGIPELVRTVFVVSLLNDVGVGNVTMVGPFKSNGQFRELHAAISASRPFGAQLGREGRRMVRNILANGMLYPGVTTSLDILPSIVSVLKNGDPSTSLRGLYEALLLRIGRETSKPSASAEGNARRWGQKLEAFALLLRNPEPNARHNLSG